MTFFSDTDARKVLVITPKPDLLTKTFLALSHPPMILASGK